jgi:uncharacterized protein with NRDE domain
MGKKRLGIGVDTNGTAAARFVQQPQNGCGGIMVFNVTKDSTDYLSEISDDPLDETVAKPGCFL